MAEKPTTNRIYFKTMSQPEGLSIKKDTKGVGWYLRFKHNGIMEDDWAVTSRELLELAAQIDEKVHANYEL